MVNSLYIHIPFCRKKCDYCDFFSISTFCYKKDFDLLVERYIDAVIKETEFYVRKYEIQFWNTIYIGGGTPSQIPSKLLKKLVESIVSLVPCKNDNAEITIEMNPDDVTEELIKVVNSCGVTRISMGIQAVDDKVLRIVNRNCSVDSIYSALKILKRMWKGSLSVDFIAGLPNHTYKSFENQFLILDEYPIDHVSLYTLTVESGTPLYKNIERGKIKWSQEKADKLWIKGRNLLKKYGYNQYEVSNFSKPGFESRHNCIYWNLENYIGVGAGASSSIYGINAIRWTNDLSINTYMEFWLSKTIENNCKIPAEIEYLDIKTQEFEYLMMGFRKMEGVSSLKYKQRFGVSLEDRLGVEKGLFYSWEQKKLAKKIYSSGDISYSLNERGIMLLNLFLESLL